MARKISLFLLASAIASSTGCTNFPLPVKEPAEKFKKRDSSGSEVEATTTPDKLDSGLDPAKDHAGLLRNVELYEETYKKAAISLKQQSYGSEDLTALGGIIGVLGGFFDKSGALYGGAGLAAGSSMYSQRYQFEVQSSNYFRASKAMRCAWTRVSPATDLTPSEVAEAELIVEKIRTKLFDAQWSTNLVSPDTEAFRKAIQRTESAQNGTKNSEASLAGADVKNRQILSVPITALLNNKDSAETKKLSDLQVAAASELALRTAELKRARLEELKAKLDECFEAF